MAPFTLWEVRAFLRRRRGLIAGVFAALAGLVVLVTLKLPSVYQATSLIVVEGHDTEQAYPGGLLTPRMEQRVRLAQAFLKSDALLGRTVVALGLVQPNEDPAVVADLVNGLRDKLDVQVAGADFLQVSLEGRDPERIARIVNYLVGQFIAENVAYSLRVVSGASNVLADDVKESERQLAAYEARIKAFRERYHDELPEQLGQQLAALDALQQRELTANRELREAKDRAAALERDLAATPKTLTPEMRAAADPGRPAPPSPAEALAARIADLQAQLDTALTKYTETHPEVIRLRRAVAEASARLAAVPPEPAPAPAPEPARPAGRELPNPAYAAAESSLAMSRATVAGLTTEHDEVVARIAALRARVQRVPQREQELAGLTRDYEALKERHRGMLAKLYQADLSRKVAREQGDERLRVLDLAVPPAVPVRPRRLLIAVAGLVLAAGAAVGAACLVDRVVDTSFHNARVVEDVLKLPVVAVIPVIGAGRRVQA